MATPTKTRVGCRGEARLALATKPTSSTQFGSRTLKDTMVLNPLRMLVYTNWGKETLKDTMVLHPPLFSRDLSP